MSSSDTSKPSFWHTTSRSAVPSIKKEPSSASTMEVTSPLTSSSSSSSYISPTSVSRMSSRVTTPDVPPNSSTTTIMCSRSRRISLSAFITVIDSGQKEVSSMMVETSMAARSLSGRPITSRSSRVRTTPMTSSTVSLNTGIREYFVLRESLRSSSRDAVAWMASISTRGVRIWPTFVVCMSSTPSIISCSYSSSAPLCLAPDRMILSSGCVTAVAVFSESLALKTRSTSWFTSPIKTVTGYTKKLRSLISGSVARATTSA